MPPYLGKENNHKDRKFRRLELSWEAMLGVVQIMPTRHSSKTPFEAKKFYRLLLHVTQTKILN